MDIFRNRLDPSYEESTLYLAFNSRSADDRIV